MLLADTWSYPYFTKACPGYKQFSGSEAELEFDFTRYMFITLSGTAEV